MIAFGARRLHGVHERKLRIDLVTQRLRRDLGLPLAIGRDLGIEISARNLARLDIFETRQQLARNTEARRHDPRCIARVHALFQHIDAQSAPDHAAQRGRQPQPLIIAATAIEADDQRNLADPICERVHVERQIRRTAFLAGLDHNHSALVRHALSLERKQR